MTIPPNIIQEIEELTKSFYPETYWYYGILLPKERVSLSDNQIVELIQSLANELKTKNNFDLLPKNALYDTFFCSILITFPPSLESPIKDFLKKYDMELLK